VIEINLTTVKVRNFDNTTTTIPTYSWVLILSKTGVECLILMTNKKRHILIKQAVSVFWKMRNYPN
jgi:miniconductance mechanosensitive channel